ncbi:mitochondrial carrier protein [Plasmodium falciparum IGH-CR14]|uniref:Mitochondrial carrier protein n=9 Tax=Plasmodium falciparum TaxID=5833 RepID=A0A024W8D9_PLAFA|nr:hypothetical protein PFFVO_02040 [Plasmodium falciparum Vietnam Oak-Knoll (FVO)]ETW31203.1 hypothetical protein PFFCH_01355 [Plasmodium falciparum FCH/4]ETW37184.1 hypothetical protein PFTANZ_02116 [Plasmodium falciparum Tanzania (2000708)]ETW43251.1 hypothetical protein PFNF135_02165 [Plasmodium falciparum NF135/5.C10]ETW49870.1 hypothetical protein PFMALIP_02060 [Plasmodium falciparum MaliPS096_E11]ETW52550.1 hypothetical protein PFUGPA_05556 [Plasmodium falciparum Palo Alto/Uganda]ETW61
MDIKNEGYNIVNNLMNYLKIGQKNDENKCPNYNIEENGDAKIVKTRTLNFIISSAVVLCVLHPLDTIRTRKQIYRVYKNSYPYYYNNKYSLLYILKKEKFESIYRGLLASLITTGVSQGTFRFIYDTLNYYIIQNFNNNNNINDNNKITNEINNIGNEKYIIYNNINQNNNNNNNKNENNINMNYYILTSSISSIISVLFLHPIWLIKTKIECTINLNYKFINYKSRILSKHYKIFSPRNKIFNYKMIYNIISLFIINPKNKIHGNYKKVRYINNNLMKTYKNNFIYNKHIKSVYKYNHLSYIKTNHMCSNKTLQKKMIHNYTLYKYYALSNFERKHLTKKCLSTFRKKFRNKHILYSKRPLSGNEILHIFKREENKNNVSAVYKYKNYFHFVYSIYKKEKLFSFYKGFLASLLLTPHVALQFYTYEYLTHFFSSQYINNILQNKNIHFSSDVLNKFLPFLYGALSKYIAIIFTYPLYTIKMRQQVQMKNYGFYKVLLNIFKCEGIRSYYTGINMHLLRNCLQNGILFFIFEYLNNAKI